MRKIGVYAINHYEGIHGGTDIYTLGMIRALAENDLSHEYHILISESQTKGWLEHKLPDNFRTNIIFDIEPKQRIEIRLYRRAKRALGLPVRLHYGEEFIAWQIDQLGLDLIHYPATTIFPLQIKTPCLLTLHDIQHEYYPEFFSKKEIEHRRNTYQQSLTKARLVVVPSNFTGQTLVDKFCIDPLHIKVIRTGLDGIFIIPDVEVIQSKKNHYHLQENYIFYPANPWPHKNHARLMAAMRILRDRYHREFSLVVSGQLKENPIKASWYAVAAGIEDQVIDIGFIPREDLPAMYAGAACLVFPSLFEGFGIPLVEAMACGCPIAASNATSIPEVVGEAAILFDPMNPEEIAAAVDRVLSDSGLREQLRKDGLVRAEQFRWDKVVKEIVKCYDEL